MINIQVYVASHCPACKKVVSTLQSFSENNSRTTVTIINITNTDSPVSIVPAVFIDDELYCYGEVDKEKLKLKISKMFAQY